MRQRVLFQAPDLPNPKKISDPLTLRLAEEYRSDTGTGESPALKPSHHYFEWCHLSLSYITLMMLRLMDSDHLDVCTFFEGVGVDCSRPLRAAFSYPACGTLRPLNSLKFALSLSHINRANRNRIGVSGGNRNSKRLSNFLQPNLIRMRIIIVLYPNSLRSN